MQAGQCMEVPFLSIFFVWPKRVLLFYTVQWRKKTVLHTKGGGFFSGVVFGSETYFQFDWKKIVG